MKRIFVEYTARTRARVGVMERRAVPNHGSDRDTGLGHVVGLAQKTGQNLLEIGGQGVNLLTGFLASTIANHTGSENPTTATPTSTPAASSAFAPAAARISGSTIDSVSVQ